MNDIQRHVYVANIYLVLPDFYHHHHHCYYYYYDVYNL